MNRTRLRLLTEPEPNTSYYMHTFLRSLLLIILVSICCNSSHSQGRLDSLLGKFDPQKFISQVSAKAGKMEEKILYKSLKALSKFEKQERKLYERMTNGKDSLYAREQLSELTEKYSSLKQKVTAPRAGGQAVRYIPKLDSLQSALKFLDQNKIGHIKDGLLKTQSLQNRFNASQEVEQFMKQRRDQIREKLANLSMFKQLKQLNKQAYYYTAQIREYKEMINDPEKLGKKALQLLGKTKLFQDFFKKNSLFATLFRMPGDPDDPSYLASLSGLQTRTQITSLIQQQISGGGPNAAQQLSQNLQAAQAEMTKLKNKVLKHGAHASDAEMPQGFKPNTQKTKSFLQRLELGTTFQSQKASNYFPTTTDLGLSVGYKLNDRSIVGIGATYKLGLGRGWDHIRFTGQGAGLRSFVDWKFKGNFWITGGFEMNYRPSADALSPVIKPDTWQQSGVVGISRSIPVRSKFFKRTKLMLLWDFLSRSQVPHTQPLIFRFGYNLN